jgi:hypothetical protein
MQKKLLRLFQVNFKDDADLWLSRQETLRKFVGILGIMLPVLLYTVLYIYNGYATPLESISHYYYTRAGSIFVITLSLLAVFLLIYKGKAPGDFLLSTAAGLFALCVVIFPTNNLNGIADVNGKHIVLTLMPDSDFRKGFHFLSAGIFLLSLAFMSIFIFTKSNLPPKQRPLEKKIRNRLSRTCGALMLLAMAIIFAGWKGLIPDPFYTNDHLTFWMETVAVESFGVSWLVKGYS